MKRNQKAELTKKMAALVPAVVYLTGREVRLLKESLGITDEVTPGAIIRKLVNETCGSRP